MMGLASIISGRDEKKRNKAFSNVQFLEADIAEMDLKKI
jgi:hypothetical protein